MSETQLPRQEAASALPNLCTELPNLRHVLACVDGPPFAEAVLIHAAAVAKVMGARLTVMHVLESSTTPSAQEPMDPVEWSLRHCDTSEYLGACILRLDGVKAKSVIVAGLPAERISTWAHDNAADLVVLGRGCEKRRAVRWAGRHGTSSCRGSERVCAVGSAHAQRRDPHSLSQGASAA